VKAEIHGATINLIQGDITRQDTDAIVNAANERLQHGGGVAGAISRKGGPVIQRESDEWIGRYGPVRTGSAAITGAGNLRARYVIHAVGPVMGSGDEVRKLQRATRSALVLAVQYDLRSITFPAISTGIFGFPVDRCADVMLSEVCSFLSESKPLDVFFCLYDKKTLGVFSEKLSSLIKTSPR
jgi:O-acetyl-ADP-ribose deacetylase (regulator of RNase III)